METLTSTQLDEQQANAASLESELRAAIPDWHGGVTLYGLAADMVRDLSKLVADQFDQIEYLQKGIQEWRSEALTAQTIAKEARDNDRTTFYYLSAIREAAGHDGDFPSLIEAVRKLAGRNVTARIQCATGCGSSVPVMAQDEGEDHICNQCDQEATA